MRVDTLGVRLKKARLEKGWKAYRLEIESGVSHDLLSRYESDECLPALRNAIRIARALDCSLDWLCCVDEPES